MTELQKFLVENIAAVGPLIDKPVARGNRLR